VKLVVAAKRRHRAETQRVREKYLRASVDPNLQKIHKIHSLSCKHSFTLDISDVNSAHETAPRAKF